MTRRSPPHASATAGAIAAQALPRSSPLLSPAAAPLLAAAAVLFAVATWYLLPGAVEKHMVSEDGFIEIATAALHFLVALAVWPLRGLREGRRTTAALSVMFFAFCAREMDLHRVLDHVSVLKIGFYFSPAPLWLKLVSLMVIAVILVALVYLLVAHWRWLLAALRRHDALAVTVLTFLATLVVSKVFDRTPDVLEGVFGVVLPASTELLSQALEETLELALPLLGLLGLMQKRLQTGS